MNHSPEVKQNALDLYEELGSARKVAEATGINRRTIDRWVRKPDFTVKSRSTLTGPDGEIKLVWEKTEKNKDQDAFQEAVKAFTDDLPKYAPIRPPETHRDDLMAIYPVGDHHIGMLSWAEETDGDYDIKISEKLLTGAMDFLVDKSPDCGEAAILFLGDFLHYDSFESITPTGGNQLDTDSRYPKMVRAAIKLMRYSIQRALEKHSKVRVIIEIGNHDLSSSIFLMECLANVYENEPRVEVDTSPKHYHYFRFGKVLIGTHHGHGTKMEKLPQIMACDRPKDWGQSDHRYWHTGHTHQKSVIDAPGCVMESHRILAPNDAWAHQKGYRSHSDMKCIVYHKDFGEVGRNTVNPAMLG